MTFDWKEFLEIAKFLSSYSFGHRVQFSNEAAIRCATSRAYYCAFCFARSFARSKYQFKPTYGPKDHRLVREEFEKRGNHDIVDELQDLRDWRNDCDYEDVLPKQSKLYLASLSSSENVISLLESLS